MTSRANNLRGENLRGDWVSIAFGWSPVNGATGINHSSSSMRMTDVVALSRPRVLSSLAGTAEPRVYGSSKANKIKTWAKHILGRGKDIAIFSKKLHLQPQKNDSSSMRFYINDWMRLFLLHLAVTAPHQKGPDLQRHRKAERTPCW